MTEVKKTPEFNSCSHLIEGHEEAKNLYEKIIAEGGNPFAVMMDMQKSLQVNLYEKLPEQNFDITNINKIGDMFEAIRDNKQSYDNEYWELVESLAWMNSNDAKTRSSIWKKWKARYNEIRDIEWDSLPEEDKLEAKFEMIDMMHFVINKLLIMKIGPQELFELYYLKNKENLRRYENNY